MEKSQGCVLVVLLESFNEVATTTLITTLREAGLQVKVVGMSARCVRGYHGLLIYPDLTLDEALPLATKTRGVVVPATHEILTLTQHEPRLGKLFQQAAQSNALFVSQASTIEKLVQWKWLSGCDVAKTYTEKEDMALFAQQLTTAFTQKRPI
jgi:hypothetical protein